MATKAEISAAAAAMGRKGGRAKSPAKTKAVRENAKLGGRPRKPVNTLLLQAARQAETAIDAALPELMEVEAPRAILERLGRAGERLQAAIAAAEAAQRGKAAKRA